MNPYQLFGLLLIALSLGLFIGHILGRKFHDGFDIGDIEDAWIEGFAAGNDDPDPIAFEGIRQRAAAWVKTWWRVQA